MDDQWNQNPNGGTPADPNAGQAPVVDSGTGAPATGWNPPPPQPDPNAGVQTPSPEPVQPSWNPTPTPPPAEPVEAPAQPAMPAEPTVGPNPATGTWDQGNQGDNSGTNTGGAL